MFPSPFPSKKEFYTLSLQLPRPPLQRAYESISKNRNGILLLFISLVLLVVFSSNELEQKHTNSTKEEWLEFVQFKDPSKPTTREIYRKFFGIDDELYERIENFLSNDTMQTGNLISTEHSIYPKNGNREERAKWWCKSWKLNNNKCQTWIKKFSEVEDPYFDLDPAEFPSLVGEITADDLNRSPNEFLIFELY
jgi:hypothetical protein